MKRRPSAVDPSRKATALHTSAKSGYVRDIAPERLDATDREAVPIASLSGKQEGRLTPAERTYNAKYETVDATEAVNRMRARATGSLPPIKGGLDETLKRRPPGRGVTLRQVQRDANDMFDNGDPPEYPETEPVQEDRPPVRTRLVHPDNLRQGDQDEQASPRDEYLKKRKRITFEMPESTFTVSAIDMVVSRYSVTILLPLNADGGTFTPKVGTELAITTGDTTLACYYPGSSFEIPALGILGLAFIRKDET